MVFNDELWFNITWASIFILLILCIIFDPLNLRGSDSSIILENVSSVDCPSLDYIPLYYNLDDVGGQVYIMENGSFVPVNLSS